MEIHQEGAFALIRYTGTRQIVRGPDKREETMSNKLFVGGLAWATDDHALTSAFSAHGEVTEARVISDRDTGRSRGFGFVTFADASAASAAIEAMDGTDLDGRTIRVNLAEDNPPRDSRGGGGDRGGRGGDRGDRGGRGGGGQRW